MDLSDPSQIMGLKPRYEPYWQTLEYCRHLGVQVHPNGGVFWIAGVRPRGGSKYAQHRLQMWPFLVSAARNTRRRWNSRGDGLRSPK